jgi:hypothetical protein
MPALSPELVKRERIDPLEAKPSGDLVTIDRSILGELVERFAEALAAIARGNTRAAGVELERRCTSAILTTGTAPADCPR